MLTAQDGESKAIALKLLGDLATPASTSLLQLQLREATAEQQPQAVSLVLRALLAADPRIARLEAVPLLIEPEFVRGALGVFALTEPAVREQLESVDVDDGDALAAAAGAMLVHLQATATEDDVRSLAGAVLGRANAMERHPNR